MSSKDLSAIPQVIQLPKGRTLQAVPFKITSYDEDGRAKTFEILPHGTKLPRDAEHCVLFADEAWIRGKMK